MKINQKKMILAELEAELEYPSVVSYDRSIDFDDEGLPIITTTIVIKRSGDVSDYANAEIHNL